MLGNVAGARSSSEGKGSAPLPFPRDTAPPIILKNFYKYNFQVFLLFQRLKTIATVVNYNWKRFIEFDPGCNRQR